MPRKKAKATPAVVKGPSQGEMARLITNSLSMFSDQLLADLAETQNYEREQLLSIKESVTRTYSRINNSSLDQLLKHY